MNQYDEDDDKVIEEGGKQEPTEPTEPTEEGKVQEVTDRISKLEEELKETREALNKERDKEKNFKNLKSSEQGKRKELSEQVDELRRIIEQEQQNRQSLQNSVMKDAKDLALDQLAGEDKDLREQLMERVKNSEAYLGSPKDSKELVKRYENAYSYLEGQHKKVNPLNAFSPVTGNQTDLSKRDKRFTDTQEGKRLFEDKFPQIAAMEKKDKK